VTAPRFCSVLLLILGLILGGCVSWRPYETGPSLGAKGHLPTSLRATRQDRSRLVLAAPFVRGDTLYGRLRDDTLGVPMGEIAGLEWERLSAGRTAGLLLGVPAVLGLTYLAMCGSSQCEGDY
jgi:hypothetical protein